jgi:ABC-type dipeptide/oligopeptide/nickel transport system permease component
MAGYLLRRLIQSIFFILLSSILIYTVLVYLMPNGPKAQYDRFAQTYAASGTSVKDAIAAGDERLGRLITQYKLDSPWPGSFFLYLFDPNDTTQIDGNFDVVTKGINVNIFGLQLKGSGMLTGDLGKSGSYSQGVLVTQLIADRWAQTASLILYTLIITMVVALPLGIIGAIRHRTAADHALTFFSFAGMSVPPFVLGLLLIIFLSVFPAIWRNTNGWSWLPFFPPGGFGDRDNWADLVYHMTLPAVTLAIPQIAWLARYTRFSMLDVMKQDYVRTAWAKGLARRKVVFRHALRNALLPMITLVGLAVPGIASAAIVVETVFGFGGLGQLFYRGLGGCLASVSMQMADPPPCPRSGYYSIDTPIAITMTILLVIVITLAAFLSDFLHTLSDPRVDFQTKQRA